MIVLSFFDGIATLLYALKSLHLQPMAALLWETDKECIALTTALYPTAMHMGDVDHTSAKAIADQLDQLDPSRTARILVGAGPPCPDYTRIKGSAAPGRKGPEGRKFDALCTLLKEIRRITSREILFLIENVVPANLKDAQHFNKRLECKALLCDPVGLGIIRRPRLWWQQIDWSRVPSQLTELCQWRTRSGFDELYLCADDNNLVLSQTDVRKAIDLVSPSAMLHPDVLTAKTQMPCLTTPARDSNGRPAPKKSRQSISPAA